MLLKHLKPIKRKTEIAVIGLAVAVIALGIYVVWEFTTPYALTKDGIQVEEPWSVKVGGKEVFAVANREEGRQIIEGIKDSYSTKNTQEDSVNLSPQITIEEKELKRGDDVEILVESEDAVQQVVEAGKTDEPILTVTTTDEVAKTKSIDYKTTYKETDDLYVGEEKVVTEGKKGQKTVVSELTKENGKVVAKEVVDTTVDKKPVAKVIAKGTKTMSVGEASRKVANGGVAMGRGSGEDVVHYAKQFIGNPYVYGGSSLTNGTDCSGFTMSVYAKFGVSLPHSSSAQRSCGKGVPYSKAKPGDIICYAGHVGIYIGGGKIVHASTPRTGIVIGSARYKHIITVRRILE